MQYNTTFEMGFNPINTPLLLIQNLTLEQARIFISLLNKFINKILSC